MKDLIVIKVGGNALDQLTSEFFEQLAAWRQAGKQILLVHGGWADDFQVVPKVKRPGYKDGWS